MGGENQDGEPSEHTIVVNIKIKPDCEKNYDLGTSNSLRSLP
jgi:hypothetical protein